jgi:hypothetical protein
MSRGHDEEAMKPMPRVGPRRPWWQKWIVLAVFAVSSAILPVGMWLFR